MNGDGDLLKATDNAVWLVAELMKRHNIPIEHVVQHHRWSGNLCPQMIRAGKQYSWDVFIDKIKALTSEDVVPVIVKSLFGGDTAPLSCTVFDHWAHFSRRRFSI